MEQEQSSLKKHGGPWAEEVDETMEIQYIWKRWTQEANRITISMIKCFIMLLEVVILGSYNYNKYYRFECLSMNYDDDEVIEGDRMMRKSHENLL